MDNRLPLRRVDKAVTVGETWNSNGVVPLLPFARHPRHGGMAPCLLIGQGASPRHRHRAPVSWNPRSTD